MIDTVNVLDKIDSLARMILKDNINEIRFSSFSMEVINMLNDVVDDYIVQQAQISVLGMNNEQASAFNDLDNGYRVQMRNWVNDNQLRIESVSFDAEPLIDKCINNAIVKNAILSVCAGNVVVVGLCVSSAWWVILLAELLILGVAYAIYQSKKKTTEEVVSCIMKIEDKKVELLIEIKKDVSEWLSKVSKQSDIIISSFKSN